MTSSLNISTKQDLQIVAYVSQVKHVPAQGGQLVVPIL